MRNFFVLVKIRTAQTTSDSGNDAIDFIDVMMILVGAGVP